MSWIFLWSEAKLHEKASESFCLHRHHGKTWAEKAVSWQVGEKEISKSPSGGGYTLTIEIEPRDQIDTRVLKHPWGNLWRFVFCSLGPSFAKKDKKKEKKSTFSLFAPPGVWTQNRQKMEKPDVKLCLHPRSQLWDLSRFHRPRW